MITIKENTMATTSKTIDMKLQVRVEDASSGTSKVKNLNFSKIKVSATAGTEEDDGSHRRPQCVVLYHHRQYAYRSCC